MTPEKSSHFLEGGRVIQPGEIVAIGRPLVGCFIVTAQYSDTAVVTHFGPGQNDLTLAYHRQWRPSFQSPQSLIVCTLDRSTTTHWYRRTQEYEISRAQLILTLAATLNFDPDAVKPILYQADTSLLVTWPVGQPLAIYSLSRSGSDLNLQLRRR